MSSETLVPTTQKTPNVHYTKKQFRTVHKGKESSL